MYEKTRAESEGGMSAGEEEFALHCKAYGLSPVREYRFCERRWRFDFAFEADRIAVEVEGGSWTNGRHNRGKGFESDCRKYSTAAMYGWRVFRFTPAMVTSGEAVEMIVAAMKEVA
jgi:very-short-patch-repair endonuclease